MNSTETEPLIGYRATAGIYLRHIVSVRRITPKAVRTSILCGGMQGGLYTGLTVGHDFAPFSTALKAAEHVRQSKSYDPCKRCIERASSAKIPAEGNR